jgi:type I restriction enzyme S subunit
MNDALFLIKTIADFTSKVGSGITPKGGSNIYTRNGPKLIRSQNIHPGRLNLADAVCIPEEIHQSMNATRVEGGDVLLNITGASIGRCAIAPFDIGEANVNQHVCIIRSKPGEIDSSFLMHYLNSYGGQDQINRFQAGGNREGLNFAQIRSMEIPLPPLPEQKKIAEILSGIDKAITSIKIARARLVLLKKSLSLKLLPTTGDQGKRVTLGNVCIRIQDGTHFSPQSKDGDHLYITSRNIRPGRLDLNSTSWISTDEHTEIYKRCPVKKGDILLTKDGANTGNACLNTLDHEFSLLSSVAFIRPEPNQCDPNYMLQWIMSDMFQNEIQQGMSGNAISRLTLTKINNLPIYLPSLEKQKDIAGILLSIDNQCKSYGSKADSLQGLKSAISSDLLSGRKRVSI